MVLAEPLYPGNGRERCFQGTVVARGSLAPHLTLSLPPPSWRRLRPGGRVWVWSSAPVSLPGLCWAIHSRTSAHSVSTPRPSQLALVSPATSGLISAPAQIDTDVNQVISTSCFSKEVWPEGNSREGEWRKEQTLSPT